MQPGEAYEVMSPEASIGASAVTNRVRRWAKAKSAFRPPVKDPLCVGPRTPTCMTRPSESRWVNRQSRADPPGLPRSGPARVPARKVAPGVREASEPRPARPPVFPIANACDYDIGGFTIVAIVRCDRRARLRSAKSDAATDSG